jgi:hypothetical protein
VSANNAQHQDRPAHNAGEAEKNTDSDCPFDHAFGG